MLHSITGKLVSITENHVIINTYGIQWSLLTSTTSIKKYASLQDMVTIFTYLHHREDAMTLFGFAEELERTLFLELIKVSGIGPKQALKILSSIETKKFIELLDAGDVDNLAAIPGLGQKSAGKIILALRGKLQLEYDTIETDSSDIIDALINMGFDRKQVKEAVAKIQKALQDTDLDKNEKERQLFKETIVLLSS